MAISDDFLKLFGEFVTNYNTAGASGRLLSGDKNHSKLSTYFNELLQIINNNKEIFNEASIIEPMSTMIILTTEHNPYLFKCWADFLKKYNLKSTNYSMFDILGLSIDPERTPSSKMIQNLQDALVHAQEAYTSAAQAYNTSLKSVREERDHLKKTIAKLTEDNQRLKAEIQTQNQFRELTPSFQQAQEQLGLVNALFKKLTELSQQQPKPESKQNTLTVETDLPVELCKPTRPIAKESPPSKESGTLSTKTNDTATTAPNEKQGTAKPLSKAPPPPPLPKAASSTTAPKTSVARSMTGTIFNEDLVKDRLRNLKHIEATKDDEKKKPHQRQLT
jgi:hypothetical protein